jgi:aspartate oxidase
MSAALLAAPLALSAQEVDYSRADVIRTAGAYVLGATVTPQWLDDSVRFVYTSNGKNDRGTIYLVDPARASRRVYFDQARMAAILSLTGDTIIDPARFPNVVSALREAGLDPATQRIPVAPASHYVMGGIATDLHGHTTVAGLYAVGECACTGLHGANRLASNSLLECLVFSESAAEHMMAADAPQPPRLPEWDESRVTDADEEVVISHNWDELRRTMWNYVGIVRTTKRLERASHRIQLLQEEIHEFYANFRVSNDLIDLRNLVITADLIVRSALARKESRGLHFSRDYPQTLPEARDTVLTP